MNDFNPKNILCPLDFSDLSNLALKYAAVGAREYGSTLTVLHAETFELPRYFSRIQTESLLQELAQAKTTIQKELSEHVEKTIGQEAKNLNIEFEVVEEPPVDAVLNTAKRKSADLIVLGTHGLSGVKRVLLGSVTENVIRYATVPIFTVRQKEHEFINLTRADTLPRIGRILCPCEVNELGRTNLGYAVSLAERFNARLTVLYSDESRMSEDLSKTKETLCNWITETVKTRCDLEPIVRMGNAADQIITHAREEKDDLIVLGAYHRIFQNATVLGKTTDLVVRHAPVPVLIIPTFL